MDCGTTSLEPLAEAKRLGLDVVVIDHHQADEKLPDAIVVNPNRLDDLSKLGHLAAVGLVFMTVVAVNRILRTRGWWSESRPEPDLLGLLEIVALGTVADVVPLRGLNRAFVSKGLIALRRRENPGLTALMDAARLSGPPEPWHLGFMLGPRINAGGRIGRADLGAQLLLTDDPSEAGRIAAELDRLNRERQTLEQQMLAEAEAEAMAALGHDEKGAVVLVAAANWHPGIVGLVAVFNAFRGVPLSLPALLRAYDVSARAAKTGFDWVQPAEVMDKIEEEVRELRAEVDGGRLVDATRAEEELGEV